MDENAIQLGDTVLITGDRLLAAMQAETRITRKNRVDLEEVKAARRVVDACAQDYLNAVARYTAFFEARQ